MDIEWIEGVSRGDAFEKIFISFLAFSISFDHVFEHWEVSSNLDGNVAPILYIWPDVFTKYTLANAY